MRQVQTAPTSAKAERLKVGLFAIASLLLVAITTTWPGNNRGVVATIFPPWIDASRAAARATHAGADIVNFGRLPFIVLVRPLRDNYPARALAEGAVLVIDLGEIRGCAPASKL